MTTSDGGQWLSITPTSGTTPTTATVSIDAASLAGGGAIAGTYTGQILFSTANGSVTVPVSVTVGGNNLVQINPLQFTMVQGGNVPLPQVIESTTSEGLSIGIIVSVSAGSGGAWLTTGTGGTSTPYTAVIGVNGNVASNLAPGVYTSEVIFSPGNGQSPLTVPVTLTVVQPSADYFNNLPGGLYFSALTGTGDPASQTIQILDQTGGSLPWTAIAATGDAGNWLLIGTTSGTTPSTLTVGIDVTKLRSSGTVDGVYTGQILVQSTQGSFTVPVIVQLGNQGFVQLAGLTFTIPPDATSKTVNVSSLGNAFSFSAAAYTADGGNWLSAPSGGTNTPFTGTYTVRTSALASGTYIGEAIFLSATAAQTVPITLIIASAPAGSITATSGAGQIAQVSTAFGSQLVVTVRDPSGNLLSGATVTFSAPLSGASARLCRWKHYGDGAHQWLRSSNISRC